VREVPEFISEPHLCDALELPVHVVRMLSEDEVMVHLGYREGKRLAEWVGANPAG
jgi:hypothetical protein